MKESSTVETIAPTMEEAIEKGLAQLNLSREDVTIEILDEGQQGFLGIGSRQVRVRMTVRKGVEHESIDEMENVRGENEPIQYPATQPEDMDELEHAKEAAISIVNEIINTIRVEAEVSGRIVQPEDEKDNPMLLVEITGKDLSILIGRRSETLNALQYISSLILNEKMGSWIPLMIDVQGYRFRRERQLRQLARRLADQVVQTGRKQVLEPMPPNERRIIHLELRYHPFVTTESIGVEPNRRTTIILKSK
jgi:spoIIIJ-associated protein